MHLSDVDFKWKGGCGALRNDLLLLFDTVRSEIFAAVRGIISFLRVKGERFTEDIKVTKRE